MYRPVRIIIATFSTLLLAQNGFAEDPPRVKPIRPETVATYKSLGLSLLERTQDSDRPFRMSTRETRAIGSPDLKLPIFYFGARPKGRLPTLGDVDVPFGLDFTALYLARWLSDDHLKEMTIATLKNLSYLGLHQSLVTDEGLKELAGLKNLIWLDVSWTFVTDAGLKELVS